MKKYWILLIAGFLVFILQSVFGQVLNIKGWTPDFLLILIFVIALHYNVTVTLLFAFIAGIFQDFFGSGFHGISSFSNVLAAYIATYFKEAKITTGLYATGLMTASFVKAFMFYFLMTIGTQFAFWIFIFGVVIPQSIYTLIIGLFIFFLFKNIITKDFQNEF